MSKGNDEDEDFDYDYDMPSPLVGCSLREESEDKTELPLGVAEDDLPVHDQLPTLEEVHQKSICDLRTETWDETHNSCYRKCIRKSFLPIVIVIGFALFGTIFFMDLESVEPAEFEGAGVVVGGTGVGTGTGTGLRDTVLDDDDNPRQSTTPPIPSPPKLNRRERIAAYVGGIFSSDATLSDPDSAQAQAVKWIADWDDLRLAVPGDEGGEVSTPSDSRFVRRYALAVLYFATGGADWEDQFNFMSYIDECQWNMKIDGDEENGEHSYGVFCDQQNHPITIDLPNNNMIGTLPPEIRVFPRLRVLNLSINGLYGTLPPEMWDLMELEHALFAWNDLSGPIPEWLGGYTELQQLSLEGNFFEGTLPSDLKYLSKLTHLNLAENKKLSGTIPMSWGELGALRSLSLSYNDLSGSIPSSFMDLTKLRDLRLSNNKFSGSLPQSFSNIKHMRNLYLDDNQFSGNLSPLGSLMFLETLSIQNNSFIDTINNNFYEFMDDLKVLDASNNLLWGILTPEIFAKGKLEILDLHGNNISNSLPEFPDNNSLKYLALQHNGLSKDLPASISNLRALTHLDLSNNKLTGPIPESIGNMELLTYLYLAANSFGNGESSPVPDFLRSLTALRELSLRDTGRNEVIPEWITELNNLKLLDLGGNALEGTLPGQAFETMIHLHFLLLDNNKLEGTVPNTIGMLHKLRILTLEGNSFTALEQFRGISTQDGWDEHPYLGGKGSVFSADCGYSEVDDIDISMKDAREEISCRKCTECCGSGGQCHDAAKQVSNLDLMWEHDYFRPEIEHNDYIDIWA